MRTIPREASRLGTTRAPAPTAAAIADTRWRPPHSIAPRFRPQLSDRNRYGTFRTHPHEIHIPGTTPPHEPHTEVPAQADGTGTLQQPPANDPPPTRRHRPRRGFRQGIPARQPQLREAATAWHPAIPAAPDTPCTGVLLPHRAKGAASPERERPIPATQSGPAEQVQQAVLAGLPPRHLGSDRQP
jgi:hypothetical protein